MNLLNIYSLSTAIFFHNLWISNERKCNSCWARNPSVYSLCPSFPSSSFSLGRRDGRDNKRRICYEEPNGLTVRPWAPFLLSLWCSWVTDRWQPLSVPGARVIVWMACRYKRASHYTITRWGCQENMEKGSNCRGLLLCGGCPSHRKHITIGSSST